MQPLYGRIEEITGQRPTGHGPLSGGCIAEIYRVDLADGSAVVAKLGWSEGDLELEAWMLRYLTSHSEMPVPAVLHGDADLLVMEYIETSGGLDAAAQTHAADLLAALHAVKGPAYGLERDTLIGSLPQPNGEMPSWVDFFAERRLLHMGREALASGGIGGDAMTRLERLAARLPEFIDEPAHPALIHGDIWGGNVLTRAGRIAGFVDPAIYFADPEIELAFSTLFSTFGDSFFSRYAEHRPLAPGFFEVRRDLYNIYPLLVHARLFGGGYGAQADAIARRFAG